MPDHKHVKEEIVERKNQQLNENFSPSNGNGASKSGFVNFVQSLVIAGVVGTGIWVFGEHLNNHGHEAWASVVNFFACVIFLSVLPLEAGRHWQRPRVVWGVFVLLCASLGTVWALAIRQLATPGLPWVQIETLGGLSGPIHGEDEITFEMNQTYREHHLIIRNTNSVDLRNLTARLQLPEPVVTNAPESIGPIEPLVPPGVHVRWMPERYGFVSHAIGPGGFIRLIGAEEPRFEWELNIDTLPALSEIQIPFLTISRSNSPSRVSNERSHILINYMNGSYQFAGANGWKTQQIVMAILFDPTNRTCGSLAPEKADGGLTNILIRVFP
jgi:hypothetical protein